MDNRDLRKDVRDAKPVSNTALYLIIVVAAAFLILFGVLFINDREDKNREKENAEVLENIKKTLVSRSSYPSQCEEFTKYFSVVQGNRDDISIANAGENNGRNYFAVTNDSHLFWTGTVTMNDGANPLFSEDVSLVMPHSFAYIDKSTEVVPNNFRLSNSRFIRFAYEEPSYEYTGYESVFLDTGIYYMAYAAKGQDVNYENLVRLARRQYAMNVMMGYTDEEMRLFDEDKTQMYDFGSYTEYDPAEASYGAKFDYSAKRILILVNENGEWTEKEWVSAFTD